MQKPSFQLVPSPEYRAEIERIARQYEGFSYVNIYAYADTQTLVIQAQYTYKGEVVRPWVDVRINGIRIQDAAELLQTLFYQELIKTFEPDFIPVENY